MWNTVHLILPTAPLSVPFPTKIMVFKLDRKHRACVNVEALRCFNLLSFDAEFLP
jgi:hypothetical protein